MATYPIRPVAEDELAGFLAVDQHASHGTPMSEHARANLLARLEFDRTLAAFGGDTIVGAAGAFSFQMRVPGAMAAVAGVSLVAVLPSHRRQGILSALMRRQLADVSERGEAVAVLFCSESGIYGRYGYGRASWQAAYRLQRGEGALAPGASADPGLRLRIAEPRSARAELAKVYDLELAERPGLYARTEPWWDRLLADLHSDGQSSRQIRCLLAEDDSGPRGYAVFTSAERWDEDAGLPQGLLEVSEAIAADPAATAVGQPAQPGPDQRIPRQDAPGGRPAAVPAGRPAPGPVCGQRWAVGPAGRRGQSPGAAALRQPGRRSHRGRRPAVPAKRRPLEAGRRG